MKKFFFIFLTTSILLFVNSYFNLNFCLWFFILIHKIILSLFNFILKILSFLFTFLNFFILFIWFFLFDNIFFFIIEFFQNPYLLLQRVLKILFGHYFFKIKYFIILNYYYYFFTPEFWVDKKFWSYAISNYNFWPNDLRFFLLILIFCFLLQFIFFFFYFYYNYFFIITDYLNLIKINVLLKSYFKFNFNKYFFLLKHLFYNILTCVTNIDRLYFKKFIPFFTKSYFIFLENYLEFSGVFVKYGTNKNKIVKKANRFLSYSLLNKKTLFNLFILNFKSFLTIVSFKYDYFPFLIYHYKNSLFEIIVVEKFFKKGFLFNKFLYQVVSNLNSNFLNLRNIVIPLNKNFFYIDYPSLKNFAGASIFFRKIKVWFKNFFKNKKFFFYKKNSFLPKT